MHWKLLIDFFTAALFGDRTYKNADGSTNYFKLVFKLTLLLAILANIFFMERYATLAREHINLQDKYNNYVELVEDKEFMQDAESYIKLLKKENTECFNLLMKCKKAGGGTYCIDKENYVSSP